MNAYTQYALPFFFTTPEKPLRRDGHILRHRLTGLLLDETTRYGVYTITRTDHAKYVLSVPGCKPHVFTGRGTYRALRAQNALLAHFGFAPQPEPEKPERDELAVRG